MTEQTREDTQGLDRPEGTGRAGRDSSRGLPAAALGLDFFDADPHTVARRLLGCTLVRRTSDGERRARLVEVEAYGGGEDPSSHANGGRATRKNASMFSSPGTIYVYSIHRWHCLNVVTQAGLKPSAVLLRAAQPLEGLDLMAARRGVDLTQRHADRKLLSGPGKMCQALDVDRALDGLSWDTPALYLEHGQTVSEDDILATPRVGLNPKTCGASAGWPWRYRLRDTVYASRG